MEKPVYLYGYVAAPYRVVAHLLRDQPEALFDQAADESLHRFNQLAAELDVEVAGRAVAREVVVTLGEFEQAAKPLPFCRRAVGWKAGSAASLFPKMEGSLEARPLSDAESQLSIVGHYHPPLGAVGALLDTLVMHRVAEASLHRFFVGVANRITQLGSGFKPSPPLPKMAPD